MPRYQYSGRTDQTKAAVKRLIDARHLRAAGRWRGAMYLAGYSIECKIKARLMEMYGLVTLEQLEVEIERRARFRASVFTHSVEVLFDLTGARERLLASPRCSSVLRAYHRCTAWRPAWRYKPDDGTECDCKSFLEAVEEFGAFLDSNI